MKYTLGTLLLLSFLLALNGQELSPDLVLFDGNIFTSNSAHPYVEALAVREGRIAAVGTSKQILTSAGSTTKQVDLQGRLVIPGINDAHYHWGLFPGDLLELTSFDPSWEEVVSALEKRVATAKRGALIRGIIFLNVLNDPRANRFELDRLAPDNPVVLHVWGPALIVNSRMMELTGIKDDDPDPAGGRYARSADGKQMTGVVYDYAAMRVFRKLAATISDDDALRFTRDYFNDAVRLGITSVQIMSAPIPPDRCVSLAEKSPTPIRVRVIPMRLSSPEGRDTTEGNDLPREPTPLVTVSGSKWVLDDAPLSTAMNFSEGEMEQMLTESLRNHDQLIVHILGAHTIETFLQAMQNTGGGEIWRNRRVRIEHGMEFLPTMMEKAKQMGVIVVVNPAVVPPTIAKIYGPDRGLSLFAYRSLVKCGVRLAIGSDGPNNPYLNIMAAATHAPNPNEAITREEAVVAYTLGSAYAEFSDGTKGSIEPGKWADLAVLSQDIFTAPAETLPTTSSVLTLVAGKVVYDSHALHIQ